jgi:inhibitor of cysteine peptidase
VQKKLHLTPYLTRLSAEYWYHKVIIMRTTYVIAAIGCVLILAAGLMAGCTGTTGTPSENKTIATQPTIAPGSVTAAPTAATTAGTGTGTSTGSGTLAPTLTLNSTSNNKIVTIPAGDRVMIRLAENPTTGYTWHATASKGLDIVSDTYTAPDTTLVGAGGYHDWILSPKISDTYTFKAISYRTWEGVNPADDSYNLVIQVTKA